VCLKQLKALVRRNLPEASPTRAVIESQPDYVVQQEYFVLAKLVSRQLTSELSASPSPAS
jgi:hypothetical protein